ncbi:MAG: ABC transporter permease [Gemmatimonadetes bacterium]|nr:ABC transporter permease [Gemmatimonadota bacterium]
MSHRRSHEAYRLLLRALPASFVAKHGADVEAAFAARLRESGGGLHLVRAWAAALFDLIRGGWSLRAATARRREPPLRKHKERAMFDELLQHVRFAVRGLLRAPGPSLVVVATLALAIGANTSVFSVINGVMLRPLEYPDADHLFLIDGEHLATDRHQRFHPGADVQRMIRDVSAFVSLVGLTSVRQNVSGRDAPEQLDVGWASAGFQDVFRVTPALGRLFDADDPSTSVVLSHAFWVSYFGADSTVPGTAVSLDGRPVTIIGVLPSDFRIDLPPQYGWPARVDMWKKPDPQYVNGDFWNMPRLTASFWIVVGRTRVDVTEAQMAGELEAVAAALRAEEADHAEADVHFAARPLHRAVVGDVQPVLLALLGAVGLVLLIACANVSSVMLARSLARRQELAVRVALGASRGRLARMLLTESCVLALLGTAVGVALAYGGTDLIAAIRPADLVRAENIQVNGTVLVFALIVAGLSTVAFGLAPALFGSHTNPHATLPSRSASAGRSARLTRVLVTGEIAVAFVLLVGAGLLLRTFALLEKIRPGFDYDGLLTYSISLPSTQYQIPAGTHRFFDEMTTRAAGLAEVQSAAVVWPIPLEGQSWSSDYTVEGDAPGDQATANQRVITPNYFETLDIPILDGRTFQPNDMREVAVVSQRFADEAWPGQPAVGKRIQTSPWDQPVWFDVIGVVGDIRYKDIREEPASTIYFSTAGWSWTDWEFGVVARTRGAPMNAVPALKALLAEMDATIPLARPRAMEGYVSDLISPNRFALALFGTFAILAVTMAMVGVYGSLSHAVGQRTREIGIRVALGARRSGIVRMVLWEGLALAAVGAIVGVVGALLLSRFVASLLYGITATDPATYIAIGFGILAVASLASYVPARRATRVDPMETLRTD